MFSYACKDWITKDCKYKAKYFVFMHKKSRAQKCNPVFIKNIVKWVAK